jgi:hypothetical protein
MTDTLLFNKLKGILFDMLGEKLAKHYVINKSESEYYLISLKSSKISFD